MYLDVNLTYMYMYTYTLHHSLCTFILPNSMEGGELFDRIQRKGHFTERGEIRHTLYLYMYAWYTCTCTYGVYMYVYLSSLRRWNGVC